MLKQVSVKNRTAFLEVFTRELILNSLRKKENMVPEMMKETKNVVFSPKVIPRTNVQEVVVSKNNEADKKKVFYSPVIPKKKLQEEKGKGVGDYVVSLREEDMKRTSVPPQKIIQKVKVPVKKVLVPTKKPMVMMFRKKLCLPINNEPVSIPSKRIMYNEMDFGRLGLLLADREVTVIECPGADDFLFVKKSGKVNVTKIKLSQEEIDRVLDNFSVKARIPLIEGVFKAIVGDLSINAVINNSSGSRFMIYKKTPYSYIEQP